jgi:ADP-heptose synthase, bifunctional sugar kinase/adenylyltransferase
MPNSRELAQVVGKPVDGDVWLWDSAGSLVNDLSLEALVVTRCRDGMSLFENTRTGL